MRLVRSVVAGVVLGALGGYAAALLRPRSVHRAPAALVPEFDPAPLSDHDSGTPSVEIVAAEVRR
jgi:hypothetical protein